MVGIYLAYTFATAVGGGVGFWGGIVARRFGVAALGALIEMVLLRRIYHAPELFQLLATFALVLVINDATLWLWGPEDLLGPRAPGLRGAVDILGRRFPSYDLLLIAIGPAVLVIAASGADAHAVRPAGARGDPGPRHGRRARRQPGAAVYRGIHAGSLLAGLGGALQLAREPANLAMDLTVIGDAFVVVVVGGMGSIPGAYLAAVLIAEIKALCIGLGTVHFGGFDVNFTKLTLVAEFVVMAVVLIVRPHGLLGAQSRSHRTRTARRKHRCARRHGLVKAGAAVLLVALVGLAAFAKSFALYAGARHRRADRRHLRHQPAFHHGAGRHAFVRPRRLFRARHLWRGTAGEIPARADAARAGGGAGRRRSLGALLFGWFAVRLSGIYLAMLTLAFAQIVWSVGVPVAGGDRRLQRRGRHLADAAVRCGVEPITSCASRSRRSSW